ncbi:MAG: hypothetical protein GY749_38710 [Desulfobacteraceae bacterium]|nr:hypothetical protein [Desulfobacteraceae bacterium]
MSRPARKINFAEQKFKKGPDLPDLNDNPPILIESHSYASSTDNYYSPTDELFDNHVYNDGISVFAAAGNDGGIEEYKYSVVTPAKGLNVIFSFFHFINLSQIVLIWAYLLVQHFLNSSPLSDTFRNRVFRKNPVSLSPEIRREQRGTNLKSAVLVGKRHSGELFSGNPGFRVKIGKYPFSDFYMKVPGVQKLSGAVFLHCTENSKKTLRSIFALRLSCFDCDRVMEVPRNDVSPTCRYALLI